MTVARVVTLVISLVLVGCGAVGFWLLSQGAPADQRQGSAGRQLPLVEAVTADSASSAPEIRQTGFLLPFREVDVAFEVRGRISFVADAFAVGNSVAPGTVLARIDTERLNSAVDQAEADLASARARAREAERAFRRQSELEERGVTAEAALDDVRAALETAEAQVAIAEARVEAARVDLRSADVSAPFQAYVTRRTASEGQIVSPGQPVGQLVRSDVARLIVGLADREVRALEDVTRLISTDVAIRRAGSDDTGPPLRTGSIVDIDARIDQATRTTNVLIDVPDPFGAEPLRLGELLEVGIPLETPTPLFSVPVDAVKDGRRVWVIGPDGTLSAREVTVVLRSDARAWLSHAADLDGARLMATDLAGATDGTRVRVAGNEESATASGGDGVPRNQATTGAEE